MLRGARGIGMAIGGTTVRRAPGKRPFIVRALRALWRLATDRAYRRATWAVRTAPKAAFQPFNNTRPDRYPRVFAFVQSRLGAASETALLSFGCSTGDEVFSLRRYFPRATIKGIDANKANIAVCRRRARRTGDPRVGFARATSVREEPAVSYDAIFCMAVLRHGSLTADAARCDHLIRFEDFATAVAEFDRCLKPGGFLAVVSSNFRFSDTATSANYETVLRRRTPAPLVRFGSDNARLAPSDEEEVVFRKLP